MYVPKHFEITDKDEIFSFIRGNAFGQLISNVKGRLYSTHLPFLLSTDNTKLIGHLALKNPQYTKIEDQEVLITFQGPHDYISPAWYVDPGVPTWNYQAVHAYGNCTVLKEQDKLKKVVESLTKVYESGFDAPWQPNYNQDMLKAIVGIEIKISEIQCKYKLSQNRSAQDRKQVIQTLKASGSRELASAMEPPVSD